MPIFKSVNKNFFKIWSRNMAYVLGFFAADGYITVNKRGGQFWCIEITDELLLRQIKKIVESEHTIGIRKGKSNKSNTYRLQIGSVEMCEDLRQLGFNERKTKSLVLPKVPSKFFSDFVRGYFDGDGNVWVGLIHKKRKTNMFAIQTVFTSCSDDFLNILNNKIENFLGVKGVRIIYKTFSRLQYSINGSLKLYKFMYNNLDTSRLFLKRKKDVFERYIKMRS